MRRAYPGFDRDSLNRSVRTELLLARIQSAIAHQRSWQRPWQRYEPLSSFLDSEIWPTDDSVLQDLSYAKLAIQILSTQQRSDLEASLDE